jgi:eukaryotic-like serine/threonine-protein kinase
MAQGQLGLGQRFQKHCKPLVIPGNPERSSVRHTLEIQEQFLGPRDIHLCATLVTLANAYQEDPTGNPTKWREAAALYSRAINLQEANLGPDHPELLATLTGYADLLRKLNEDSRAAEVQSRIDRIQKKLKEQTLL